MLWYDMSVSSFFVGWIGAVAPIRYYPSLAQFGLAQEESFQNHLILKKSLALWRVMKPATAHIKLCHRQNRSLHPIEGEGHAADPCADWFVSVKVPRFAGDDLIVQLNVVN